VQEASADIPYAGRELLRSQVRHMLSVMISLLYVFKALVSNDDGLLLFFCDNKVCLDVHQERKSEVDLI
jgi:hypothetical protein